ncbi:hypothetical protein SAMN05428942_6258 [Streptomyces sp. 2112.2]|nr:hypothetical protein SAMN05428943_6258 [Streptomyces sp. 2314.4]SEF02634.1 hypothetical protein SAMN05428942_6258 [Streptomyces sp. 2112.2]
MSEGGCCHFVAHGPTCRVGEMSTRTHARLSPRRHATRMTTPSIQRPTTTAFFVQSAISFGLSLAALMIGITRLPVGPWERGFLALGLIFVVSSAFTLAKCVRDRQEVAEVTNRVDKARIDKILIEQDVFHPGKV